MGTNELRLLYEKGDMGAYQCVPCERYFPAFYSTGENCFVENGLMMIRCPKCFSPREKPWVRQAGKLHPQARPDLSDTTLFERAARIDAALMAYRVMSGPGSATTDQDELRDFLTDTRHWADRQGLDTGAAVHGSFCMWAKEINDEG